MTLSLNTIAPKISGMLFAIDRFNPFLDRLNSSFIINQILRFVNMPSDKIFALVAKICRICAFFRFLSLLLHQTPPLTGRRRAGGIGQRSATKRVDVVQIGIPSCFWSAKPDKIAAKAAKKRKKAKKQRKK